jgi:hypothetical protein
MRRSVLFGKAIGPFLLTRHTWTQLCEARTPRLMSRRMPSSYATRSRAKREASSTMTAMESLISLASRAAEVFERWKAEQKRQLLVFVFSNLRLKGKRLEYSLRLPFDLMVNRARAQVIQVG